MDALRVPFAEWRSLLKGLIRPFRRVARWLSQWPDWVKIPFAVAVGGTLCLFLIWLYLTRSVGAVRVPSVDGKSLQEARRILRARDIAFEVTEKSSMKTEDGIVIRQVPRGGSMMKESRSLELVVSTGAEYVEVPDVTGRALLAARNALFRESGDEEDEVGSLLTLGNIARVYSETQPENHIVLQQPHADRRVLRGSRIDLLVSKGEWPRRTVVPNVHGRSLERAKHILARNHLSLRDVEYRRAVDEPPAVVLSQSPPPNRIVPRDRSVTLTVNLEAAREVQRRRQTLVRINPPLSVRPGRMRVVRKDQRGTAEVYSDTVPPGRTVQFVTSVDGSAELTIYWNDEIVGFRHLEASE